jgi:hypothetical protein
LQIDLFVQRMILRTTMEKCHCAEVYFQDILKIVKDSERPILEVARELGAAETCTACVSDMLSYIESRLEGRTLAGHTNY